VPEEKKKTSIEVATEVAVESIKALMHEYLASNEKAKYARISQLCGQASGLKKMVATMVSDFDGQPDFGNENEYINGAGNAGIFHVAGHAAHLGPTDQIREVLIMFQPMMEAWAKKEEAGIRVNMASELHYLSQARTQFENDDGTTLAEFKENVAHIDARIKFITEKLGKENADAVVSTNLLWRYPPGIARPFEVPPLAGAPLADGEARRDGGAGEGGQEGMVGGRPEEGAVAAVAGPVSAD